MSLSRSFAITASSASSVAQAQQSVDSLTLINADTNLPIAAFDPFVDGTTLDLSTLPTTNLNVRANTTPQPVGSVRFSYDGVTNFQTENVPPYALGGDSGGNYNDWTPTLGSHVLTATPFTGSNGSGTSGTPITINFNVVNDPGDPVDPECDPPTGTAFEVTGELKKWHRVTITFEGPCTDERATINPFLDYRLNVTFTNNGESIDVPGFFAADGNAAETSASAGRKWRVHFTPNATGTWSFVASFRTGTNISINPSTTAGTPTSFDGTSGSFSITPTDKSAPDFRAKGLLRYTGEYYYQFAETGEYYIKGGADSPENILGYFEFDNTQDLGGIPTPNLINGLHQFAPHVADWQTGDPTWQGGKGKGIIGAMNYLGTQGINSVYFLTHNLAGGDGQDTWPWTDPNERLRFDCSKLDQWEIVFAHMDTVGLQLHVVTQETENDLDLDGGALGIERTLYYRELVARFSHHLAVMWNLGEENNNSNAQRIDFADYIRNLDPYDHPITVHTQNNAGPSFYNSLYGQSSFEGTSLQGSGSNYNSWAIDIRSLSDTNGRKWAVYGDEQGPAVVVTLSNLDTLRTQSLWGNLMGGGAGVEWYFGYQSIFGDVQTEDWSLVEPLWQHTRYALDFFQTYLPFPIMSPDNSLVTQGQCLALVDDLYAVYLPNGGSTMLDLGASTDTFNISWYDPRNGGTLQIGSVPTVTGPGSVSLGDPPSNLSEDWAILVERTGFSLTDKILVFTKTAGFQHSSIPAGVQMVEDIGAECGFDVDVTEDETAFTTANLQQYKAVVWLNTTGDVLNAQQQTAFEQFIQSGHGYVGIHSASDTEYGWPWYGGLLGNDAWFDSHPAIQDATVIVENSDHISSYQVPDPWVLNEEWYNFQQNPRPAVDVLLTLDESSYNGGNMGTDHPIAWRHEYDGGRSWYTGIGHKSETYANPDFKEMIRGAIIWSGNLSETSCCDAVPFEPCQTSTTRTDSLRMDDHLLRTIPNNGRNGRLWATKNQTTNGIVEQSAYPTLNRMTSDLGWVAWANSFARAV